MATNPLIEEARRRNPSSFGDAAAASLDSRVAQIPTAGAPKAPPADGSQSNPLNTDLGRNLTNAAAALPGAAAIPGAAGMAGGLVARAFGASQPAVSALGQAAQAAAPYAPVVAGGTALAAGAGSDSSPPAPPAATPPQPARSLVAAAGIPLPGAAAAAPASPAAAAPAAAGPSNVTRVGNSYTGAPNISGDITVNGAAPGGAPAAPRSLVEAAGIVPGSAGRSNSGGVMSNPLVASALGGGTGVEAPLVRHSGNDWAARNELRNAQVSASSITNNGGRWDQHKGMSPEAAYAAALGNADMAARAGQAGADVAAMRESAGLLREGLQQGGANQRSLWQYALEQDRNAQAREAMGYTNRTNALVEAARRQVAAEQDPTKRRSLVEYMRDVEGRAQPADPYLVVPGGQNVDPISGKAYNTPSTVFNRQSGQFVQQPQVQGAQTPPAVGSVQQGYRFKGGDPASPGSWERV